MTRQQLIIGIDPGLTGAIATLSITGQLVDLDDMPIRNRRVNAQQLPMHYGAIVGIETIETRPHERAKAVLTTGINGGILHGFYSDLQIVETRGGQWGVTAGIPAGTPRKQRKTMARQLAADRWPEHAAAFARVKDSGRADACWIAEHTRVTILQQPEET